MRNALSLFIRKRNHNHLLTPILIEASQTKILTRVGRRCTHHPHCHINKRGIIK